MANYIKSKTTFLKLKILSVYKYNENICKISTLKFTKLSKTKFKRNK